VAPPAEYAGAPDQPSSPEFDEVQYASASSTASPPRDEEDVPQGLLGTSDLERPYTSDRLRLAALRQWFAPLPNRPKIAPLDRDQITTRVPDLISEESANQLLEEAEQLRVRRDDRMTTAESKATTLMGTVAIAASLVVAGSGLILDSSKVPSPWRGILMAIVAVLLFFLLMCGYVASRALLRVFLIKGPQARAAVKRAATDNLAAATRDRAIDVLDRAGQNLYVADYKLAQVRIAYRWYQLALGAFFLLGLTLLAYVLFGHTPQG
jgi:hypothetical protein